MRLPGNSPYLHISIVNPIHPISSLRLLYQLCVHYLWIYYDLLYSHISHHLDHFLSLQLPLNSNH